MPRPRLRPLAAVTFDVGGTLIECQPSVGHLYAEVAARHGHPGLSPEWLNANFKKAWQQATRFSHTPAEWAAIVDETFCGSVEPPPSKSFFPQLYDRFSEPDAWHVFEDVMPILEHLRSKGVKLGVISNWDDRLRPLLRKLGLEPYFDVITVSCEQNACKPARTLFERTCALLKTAPEDTAHVGDSLDMDVRGAEAAGLAAFWLRRGAASAAPGVIGTLLELNKI
ncbi:MAG TPA: HAD-IA family hydrolase [Verrucomicrobiae bacterium]|nr:HAD-IA family hydrolase [Verrucomicrobiae bacterium]